MESLLARTPAERACRLDHTRGCGCGCRRVPPLPDLDRRDGPQSDSQPGAPLPIATFTPGAVSTLTAAELCSGTRPSRLVTAESRTQVLRDYGMERVSVHTYELDGVDHSELGGQLSRRTSGDNATLRPYGTPRQGRARTAAPETRLRQSGCAGRCAARDRN